MTGTLYKSDGEQFVSDIDYQVYGDSLASLWGEFRPREYIRIDDGGDYVIELADKRKCQCYLRKKVNAAVGAMPGSFAYSFRGMVTSKVL